MGEHKLREAGNGDTPVSVSSHIARVIDLLLPMDAKVQEKAIEEGFEDVKNRAHAEDSLIMTVTHSVQIYTVLNPATNLFEVFKSITIVAQRVSRPEWEKQQRMLQMGRR
jgi:hypothetical protein